MTTISQIAKLLDKPAKAYDDCVQGAKKAYLRFAELDTDRQAKLVRPLALGLLEGETKSKAQQRLKKAVENYRYRVGTGFLSTSAGWRDHHLGKLGRRSEPEPLFSRRCLPMAVRHLRRHPGGR